MIFDTMATIRAISYILPDTIYSNDDFFSDFPEAKGTNLEKTGVVKRHLISPGQTASDLAVLAAEKLFAEHLIDRNQIDFILLVFLGPDYYLPASSGIVHAKLGLRSNCGALDIEIGCSAYGYSLSIAAGLIAAAGLKNVLILTASSLTRTIHPKDRGSRFVFGDGAAATLITSDGEGKLGPFVYGNDSSKFEKIIIRDGGQRNPLTPQSFIEHIDENGNLSCDANFFMDGIGVLHFSIRQVPRLVAELLEKAGLQKEDIDLYVFHQPNMVLNESIRKKIGIPEEKFVHCISETGNTVQSTIPIALYESIKNGRLKRGMKVLTASFGVGLSWSGAIIHY
jgi:3-oxoacyl-[acyl-carrier-protein] synthase-3